MKMPEPDAGVIARRAEIIKAMQAIVLGEGVITDEDELRVYDHALAQPGAHGHEGQEFAEIR